MTDMIERVAKAIYAAHCAGHVPPIQPLWDADPDGRRLALADARAAVKAMGTRSDGLGRAIGLAMEREGLSNISIGAIWAVQDAMIAAALAD